MHNFIRLKTKRISNTQQLVSEYFHYLRPFGYNLFAAYSQKCMSSVSKSSRRVIHGVIYVKERIVETISPCTCFFFSQSRKILHDRKRKIRVDGEGGGGRGGESVRNVARVTGRRCTREQSAPPQSRGSRPRRVPALVSVSRENARSRFARSWSVVRSEETRLLHSAFIFSRRAN